MTSNKTYHADPNDHDAVAAALLEKLQDQQAENAMSTRISPSLFAVMAECGQGVIFGSQMDATWTLTGEGTGSDGFGVPTIGERFREAYHDQQLTAYRVLLMPMNTKPEMVMVTKKDAIAFCQIVSALGLEEDEEANIVSWILTLRTKEAELLEFVEKVQAWHEQRLAHTRDIQRNVKEGMKVQLCVNESEDRIFVLSGREAAIFHLGMETGLASFEKLPFSVSRGADTGEEDEE